MYYSRNVKDQMQYPRKIYFIGNGFLKYLSQQPGESRILENVVAVELKRRGYEFFYWRNGKGRGKTRLEMAPRVGIADVLNVEEGSED